MPPTSKTDGIAPDREVALAYLPVVRGYFLAASIYYLVISLSHPFFEKGWDLFWLGGLAVLAGATALFWWRVLAHERPRTLRLEVAALSVNGLMLVNVVACQLLRFEALKLIYFVLMCLVFATSAPSRRVAYLSVAASVTTFFFLAQKAPGDLISSYLYVGIAGVFAAIGMSTLMRGAVLRATQARLASEALNRDLARELEEGRRLRNEAQELAVRAEAASRAKSEFLATISHEIRTPLNGVLGMAQAMARDPLDAAQSSRLALIQASARTLLDVVNDVLDISKIEAGKLDIAPAPFDFARMVENLGRLYEGLARDKGLRFDLVVEPGAAGWRVGDEVRLRQVFSNLISNALKFTDQGAVEVRVGGDANGVSFVVNDTGIGIPDDRQPHIFDRFAQADGASTRRIGGSGLGLAICAELLTLMGGWIEVESAVGVGSRFTVTAPLMAVAAGPGARPEAAEPSVSDDLRVLIVDDNAVNRTVLQTLLGHAGVVTEVARDGLEALDAWRSGRWDAILMDIHMPEMDGLVACREIRQAEAGGEQPRTPIVAVTASVLAHETAQYFEAGMDGVLAKPIEAERLFQTLEAILAAPPQAEAAARA